MTDRVGQNIGNYRLIRLLGEGGFAEVYLGEHRYLGSQAAIKLLHTHVAQSEITQFQQEGRMLANLIHFNIVRILDFGVDDRIPYLIMDYAPGGTLRTRHPKGSCLPLSTVVQYVKQIGPAFSMRMIRSLSTGISSPKTCSSLAMATYCLVTSVLP
jgi:serine/threonine protein kinase